MSKNKALGNDCVEFVFSPLGMYQVNTNDSFIISVLNRDGGLNVSKLSDMLCHIANSGANAIRELPFWIKSLLDLKTISPFWAKGLGDKFTIVWNEQYFVNQRIIAKLCNDYKMRYWFCLFDHCHTKFKTSDGMIVNPWFAFSDFFYGEDARDVRREYIQRMVRTFVNLDVGYELCNEPKSGCSEFLFDTYYTLWPLLPSPDHQIIIGIDYHLKEINSEYGRDYRELREKIVTFHGDKSWRKKLKTNYYSPVHNICLEFLDNFFVGAAKGGDRCLWLSFDGTRPRPNKNHVFDCMALIHEEKNKAIRDRKIAIEVIYGKEKGDPTNSGEGVTDFYISENLWFRNVNEYDAPLPVTDYNQVSKNWAYVKALYRAILDREADFNGLCHYTSLLDEGIAISRIAFYLMTSTEYIRNIPSDPENMITQMYIGILGRMSTKEESDAIYLSYKANRSNYENYEPHITRLLTSDEFKEKHFFKNWKM